MNDTITCNKSGTSYTKTYFFEGSGNYAMDFEFNAHQADVQIKELIETENGIFSLENRKIEDLTLTSGEIMTSKSGGLLVRTVKYAAAYPFIQAVAA